MDDLTQMGSFFKVEELQRDDPRIQEILNIPEEEKQPSFYAIIQLMPGAGALEMEQNQLWHHFQLTAEDFNRLQALGLTGELRLVGCVSAGDGPHKARTLIVGRHQIAEPVDLPQPNGCEVIYYQEGGEWRKVPADAPVLRKRFRLSVDAANKNRTHVIAESYFGCAECDSGGGWFDWDNAV